MNEKCKNCCEQKFFEKIVYVENGIEKIKYVVEPCNIICNKLIEFNVKEINEIKGGKKQ